MWTLRWATTWARILDHCAVRRQSWGRGPSPQGWRRLQARRSTCLLLRALQRRRVESLVLGALSSSPVHRTLVLVLGTNIAVLLDCSKSSRQCSLFLTYLLHMESQWGSSEPRRPRALKSAYCSPRETSKRCASVTTSPLYYNWAPTRRCPNIIFVKRAAVTVPTTPCW